jgi:hypothetical protein
MRDAVRSSRLALTAQRAKAVLLQVKEAESSSNELTSSNSAIE